MKYTNNLNLPHALHNAIITDEEKKYNLKAMSVTQLISPPYMMKLKYDNYDDIEIDVSDMIYILMGKALHNILENAPDNSLRESRLISQVGDFFLSGKFDRMFLTSRDGGISSIIQDYKQASIWEYIYGIKEDKIQQLNCYAYLAEKNGYRITGLEIVFIFRDWSKRQTRFKKDYPQRQVQIIPIELWPLAKTEKFIIDRFKKHNENIQLCTPGERWKTKTTFAVMKKGNKRAVKLFDNLNTAKSYIIEIKNSKDIYIEERPSEDIRCNDYCEVCDFCEYYKKIK